MRLVGIGDNVLDIYVDLGVSSPGGNALNVAANAALLGAEAGYIGAVGTDEAGARITAALAGVRVDTTRLRHCAGSSAHAIVHHHGVGDRTFGRGDKGVSVFAADEGDLSYLSCFDVVHSSYASGLETQVPDLSKRAKLSFDFGVRADQDYIRKILPFCWFAVFSAASRTDREIQKIRDAAAGQVPFLLFTRGGGEATLVASGFEVSVAPEADVKLVDTLGAGDAFIAAMLISIWDLTARGDVTVTDARASLKHAHQVAAKACGHLGAFCRTAPIPENILTGSDV